MTFSIKQGAFITAKTGNAFSVEYGKRKSVFVPKHSLLKRFWLWIKF